MKNALRRLPWLITALALLFSMLPFAAAAAAEITIPNGGFEAGAEGWTFTAFCELIDNSSSASHTGKVLNLWLSNSEDVYAQADYTAALTAGEYWFTFEADGANTASGLTYQVLADGVSVTEEVPLVTTGWDVWTTCETAHFTLDSAQTVVFRLGGTVPAGYWGHLDALRLYGTGGLYLEDEQDPNAGIYVPKLSAVGREGFIRGTDVSSYLSVRRSGASFYDFDGNALDDLGFFRLLANCGFNYVRLRVWNDPYDAAHNGYGGGNCDLDAALTMGRLATDAGLKVLIDFHYSDFWADPGKQTAPKAWSGYSVEQKAAALSAYTEASLDTLLSAGVDVGMVQIGNETNGWICGESSWESMAALFSAGSAAVRTVAERYEKDILVALHFTNPETAGRQVGYARMLEQYHVDYDVFATSWYPYWHGTTENLTAVLGEIAETYGKQVIIAETSWAWTLEDGDGWANTVRAGANDADPAYAFSVQGQANELGAAANAVLNVGAAGLGLFYWENAWLPVAYAYDDSGTLDEDVLHANQAAWEQYGSGWASSYAAAYDPDAAVWYGGSAVDNQAMFDFTGHPLPSLKTFLYMMNGAAQTVIESVESIEAPALTLEAGQPLVLPQTVKVQYAVAGAVEERVVWDADELAAVDPQTPGVYTVQGAVEVTRAAGEYTTVATVTVLSPNLLQNPGFEQSDLSMYAHSGGTRLTSDKHTGAYCYHFYSASGGTVELAQTLTLPAGGYSFDLFTQGEGKGSEDMYVYVRVGEQTLTESFLLTGWADSLNSPNWKNPTIVFTVPEEQEVTVGLHLAYGNGGWGAIDDLSVRALPPAAPADPQLVANSLTLTGEIGVNFYVALNDAAAQDVSMCFTWGEGKSRTVTFDTLVPVTQGEYAGCFVATVGVAAKEMTAPIQFTLFWNGEETASGSYAVTDYAKALLEGDYSDGAKTLTRAMLAYGAQAQRYFGYRTDDPADACLDATEGIYPLTEPEGLTQLSYTEEQFAGTGLRWYGSSLLLRTSTVLRLYFSVTDEATSRALEVRCGDRILTPTFLCGGRYVYYDLPELRAGSLTEELAVTFGTAAPVVFNPGSYMAQMLQTSQDEALLDVLRALWAYDRAAAQYFAAP